MQKSIKKSERRSIEKPACGKILVIAGVSALLFLPAAKAAADDRLDRQIEKAKEEYIAESAGHCSVKLAAPQEKKAAGRTPPDPQTAYKQCLEEYGIIYAITDEELGIPDTMPFGEITNMGTHYEGTFKTPDGKRKRIISEEDIEAAIFQNYSESLGDFYSLNSYGRQKLAERLQNAPDAAVPLAPAQDRNKQTAAEQKEESAPRRIYRQPPGDDSNDRPSPVFRDFSR